MKILGIDSSGMVASVAIVEDGVTKAEYTVNNKLTHSQTLLPMLDEVVTMLGEAIDDVDAIAVAAGPGSFTGLRIGCATAKGIAMAFNKPIVPVETVAALAYNLWGSSSVICPLMDARRNQTYTGLYEFVQGGDTYVMNTILPQCAVALSEIISKVNEIGREVIFLGDGVPVFLEQIKDTCTVQFAIAPASHNRQRATSVCALGEVYFAQGRSETAAMHAPIYLRMSQAQRERMEQENNQIANSN